MFLNFTHPSSENLLNSIQILLTRSFSHLYYPSCSESVALVGDPGRDLELWLLTPLDSWTDSSPRERRISSVIGSGSFVGEGSLGTCTVLRRGVSMQTIWDLMTFLWDPSNENINNERAPEYHFRCVRAFSRKLYISKTIVYKSFHFSSASCQEIWDGQNLYQLRFNSIDSWFPYLLSGSSRSKWLSSDPENKVVSQWRLQWWNQDSQTSISLKRRVCRLWDLIIRRGNLTPK